MCLIYRSIYSPEDEFDIDTDDFSKMFQKAVARAQQDTNKNVSSDEDDEFYDGFMNEESEEDEEGDGELNDEDLKKLMAAMDRELSKTTIGKSFERVPKSSKLGPKDHDDEGSSDEDLEGEVDPQLNLVKNFLESYAAQEGTAGPVSSLLNELGRRAKK